MITQNGIAPFVAFRYERIILAVEETTSANRCGSSLAAFSRPASACPSDSVFFYLWKGVKEYEPEVHLPRLWDTLGL